MNASATYIAAYEAHNVALREFNAVRDAYRARKVDDAEFLAARAALEAATDAYDLAYATELGNSEVE